MEIPFALDLPNKPNNKKRCQDQRFQICLPGQNQRFSDFDLVVCFCDLDFLKTLDLYWASDPELNHSQALYVLSFANMTFLLLLYLGFFLLFAWQLIEHLEDSCSS